MGEELNFFDVIKTDMPYVARITDESIEVQIRTKNMCYDYNNSRPDEIEKRQSILRKLFGTTTEEFMLVEPDFHCDYGYNIHVHGFVLMNYNCTILDTSPVHIGAGCLIGPGCVLACPGHGIHPEERHLYTTSKPITLKDKVWLGANVTVRGGVTIGEGSIIGAGSVVVKDIPAGVIAAGNPCRVLREITELDRVNMPENIKVMEWGGNSTDSLTKMAEK